MSAPVIVRPAVEGDLPAILALHAQPELDGDDGLSLEEAKAVFHRFAHYPDYKLYVAEENGAVVGTFALLVMENLGHKGARSGVVEGVAVAPDRQGGGIGQVMMRFAMEKAALSGCYKLALSSGLKRERAHAFYDRLGFSRHGASFYVELPVPSPEEVAP